MIEEDYKDNLRVRAAKLLDTIALQVEDFINNIQLPEIVSLTHEVSRIQKEVQISEIDIIVSVLTIKKFELPITDKARHVDFLLYKQVTWYILVKFGFSLVRIGKHFDMTHSNILMGVRAVKNSIAIKEAKTIRLFYHLLNHIQSNFENHAGNISFNIEGEANTESIFPPIKYKGRDNNSVDQHSCRAQSFKIRRVGRSGQQTDSESSSNIDHS